MLKYVFVGFIGLMLGLALAEYYTRNIYPVSDLRCMQCAAIEEHKCDNLQPQVAERFDINSTLVLFGVKIYETRQMGYKNE